MKDLDFDELDRAVNSLMTNVPKSASQQDDTKEKTLDIAPTLSADAAPSFDKIEETAAKVADDTAETSVVPLAPRTPPAVLSAPRPQAAPATRRGGRFMDVVHPSTDMKKPDTSRSVSRQGVSLDPIGTSQKITDIVPQKKDVAPAVATDKLEETSTVSVLPKAETEQQEAETPKSTASTSDWPDPLEMAAAAESATPNQEIDEAEKSEAEMPEPDETAPAPLTSPFLPDAKVEKRPLGGVTPEEEPGAEEDISRAPMADEIEKTVDDPNKQLPATPGELEQVLPEELSGDLMAVEADTTHAALKQAHDDSKPDEMPASEKEETTAPEIASEVEETKPEPKPAPSTDEKPVPTGPTSIPQQYREEPNTGDQDNGSIYDTDTYHQPLAHPAKKKSGWMWVIWIVVILLVGAGGGALIYSLGLV